MSIEHTNTLIINKNQVIILIVFFCHSVTPLTISVSSSEDEPRLKRKRVKKVSNDSSENESRKKRKDHQVKKKPEKSHVSDKRRIPEQPEFVTDRNSSSFAQDFHHCEVCGEFYCCSNFVGIL